MTLFPTANLFAAGHRIRLDVSSSNFPKYDVNPNTGEPEGAARHVVQCGEVVGVRRCCGLRFFPEPLS